MHEGTVVGFGLLMILCVEAVSNFCSSPKEEINQAFTLYQNTVNSLRTT